MLRGLCGSARQTRPARLLRDAGFGRLLQAQVRAAGADRALYRAKDLGRNRTETELADTKDL